jgi:hypothetical protein
MRRRLVKSVGSRSKIGQVSPTCDQLLPQLDSTQGHRKGLASIALCDTKPKERAEILRALPSCFPPAKPIDTVAIVG